MTAPLLTFAEAEAVGQALHDSWERMTGEKAPFHRDDLAWPDLVRFTIRKARDAVSAREGENDAI